jgi:uncharacterized protein with NAD-binding domain and iron-sulfur cluster
MATKVIVLGGGIGSLAAAYELSRTPSLRRQYDVTVFQMGWRLGGKGASGRRTDPGGYSRIEEHGLHIWLGNYQNAFLLMRDCYDHCRQRRLMPNSPFQSWEDAFKGHSLITMMEQRNGQWKPWQVTIPQVSGWPGEAEQCLSLMQLVRRMIELISGVRQETPGGPALGLGDSPLQNLDRARALAQELLTADILGARPRPQHERLHRHLADFRKGYRAANQQRFALSDVWRRRWILVDLAATLALGVLADVVIPGKDSLDVLDDVDFRPWLARHGADPDSIDSAPVRNSYEIVFGYRQGLEAQPDFAAGAAVRFLLRWVGTYRGAFIYEMQAGMGDVVFSPLYLTLRDRGVKFRFFQRILSLHLDSTRRNVERIRVGAQVKLLVPEYNPLVEINGVPSWPAAPLYQGQIDSTQASAIEALKQTYPGLEPLESAYSPWQNHHEYDLRLGDDFNRVVLGIPLGALPIHCAELIAANPAFAAMVAHVGTVATQSFQLWLNKDADQLGFASAESAILDSYRDSFADFSHLIPRETHPPGTVSSIGYFCKTLGETSPPPPPGPNPGYEQQENQRVKCWSRDTFLNGAEGMRPVWPNSYDPGTGQFRWDWLTDLQNAVGPDRFDRQYWRSNVNPSSRYVQALVGTTKYRLRSEESGFENLAMAGDWIRTGINAGCIEGATVGGMQAARAISGLPRRISGEHDFCREVGTGLLATLASLPGKIFDAIARWFGALFREPRLSPLLPVPRITPRWGYVERGGEQVFKQPFAFENCTVHAFVVEAPWDALQALCDKYLNNPSHQNVTYLPATNRVLVARLDVGKGFPLHPGQYDYGYIKESDVAFFIPVIALQAWKPVRLGFFPPYLYVDHPWGVLSGREIYGLNKIPSQVSPIADSGPALFAVETYAVRTTGTGTEVPQQQVLSVLRNEFAGSRAAPGTAAERAGPSASGAAQPVELPGAKLIGDARARWDAISRAVFGPEIVTEFGGRRTRSAVADLMPFGALTLVTLKQFRDVADGGVACYQSITESPARITDLVDVTTLSESYRLRIETLVSQPLLADFGWSANEQPITTSLKIDFNFEIDAGTEIWRA